MMRLPGSMTKVPSARWNGEASGVPIRFRLTSLVLPSPSGYRQKSQIQLPSSE
jgi:hypothetical protein